MTDSSDPGPGAAPPPPPPHPGAGPGPLRPALPWSPTGAIGFGWHTMKREPMCILVLFVGALVGNLLSILGSVFNAIMSVQHDHRLEVIGLVVYGASALISMPVSLWMQMGMTRYAIKLARRQPAGFDDIFTGGPFWSFLGAGLLVGLGVLGGMLLCIVPGVILALGWIFNAQLVVDRRLPALEAISESWRMTKGHKGDIFLFALLSMGVVLLGELACCVGVLVAIPVVTTAIAYIYLKLTGEEPPSPA